MWSAETPHLYSASAVVSGGSETLDTASSAFGKGNSAQQIQEQLSQLRDKFGLAKANAIAAAGGEVPAEYADKVSSDYLNGGSLDNNATIANDFRKLPADQVGPGDRLLFVIIDKDAHHGTEYLLLNDSHGIPAIREYGRGDIGALG